MSPTLRLPPAGHVLTSQISIPSSSRTCSRLYGRARRSSFPSLRAHAWESRIPRMSSSGLPRACRSRSPRSFPASRTAGPSLSSPTKTRRPPPKSKVPHAFFPSTNHSIPLTPPSQTHRRTRGPPPQALVQPPSPRNRRPRPRHPLARGPQPLPKVPRPRRVPPPRARRPGRRALPGDALQPLPPVRQDRRDHLPAPRLVRHPALRLRRLLARAQRRHGP